MFGLPERSLDFPRTPWYVVVLERQVSTMTTLENLYYGNIAPHEYEVERGSEYDVTAKLVIRHEQELSATLTEQQKRYTRKNQRQSYRIDEPRRTQCVLPGFLFSCQTSNRSHDQQILMRNISSCVAQSEKLSKVTRLLTKETTHPICRGL